MGFRGPERPRGATRQVSGRNDDAVTNMDRDAIKRLEVWIARQSGGRAQVSDLRQLSGGAIQENWALKLDLEGGDWLGSHDLVLRKDAPSNVAVSHGRAEEFTILKHAHDAGAERARGVRVGLSTSYSAPSRQ